MNEKTTEWLEKKLGQATDAVMTAHDRIEALEAALRTIRDDKKNCLNYCRHQADRALRTSARAALDKDAGQ